MAVTARFLLAAICTSRSRSVASGGEWDSPAAPWLASMRSTPAAVARPSSPGSLTARHRPSSAAAWPMALARPSRSSTPEAKAVDGGCRGGPANPDRGSSRLCRVVDRARFGASGRIRLARARTRIARERLGRAHRRHDLDGAQCMDPQGKLDLVHHHHLSPLPEQANPARASCATQLGVQETGRERTGSRCRAVEATSADAVLGQRGPGTRPARDAGVEALSPTRGPVAPK